MNKPYRPSNGTEGMIFEEKYCNHCKKQYNEETDEWCSIWMNAGMYDDDDPDYPKELIYEDEDDIFSGKCTAFEREE